MERQILFKYPRTGMNVQQTLEDDRPEAPPENTHVAVRCPACMALHFVNSATGRLLGERGGSQPGRDQRSA